MQPSRPSIWLPEPNRIASGKPGALQGRGFGSVSRGFDGKIKLTKKAARTQAANDGAASSSNREGSQ